MWNVRNHVFRVVDGRTRTLSLRTRFQFEICTIAFIYLLALFASLAADRSMAYVVTRKHELN